MLNNFYSCLEEPILLGSTDDSLLQVQLGHGCSTVFLVQVVKIFVFLYSQSWSRTGPLVRALLDRIFLDRDRRIFLRDSWYLGNVLLCQALGLLELFKHEFPVLVFDVSCLFLDLHFLVAVLQVILVESSR